MKLIEKNKKYLSLITIITICIIIFSGSLVLGDEAKKEKISTSSDKVFVGLKGQYIEFVGNFRGKYGESYLNADRVKVFYYSKDEQKKLKNVYITKEFRNDKVKKIIATGNVKIYSEGKTVHTESAVYTDKTGILVLSGKNTKMITGNSKIEGSRIEYNIRTGQMAVEGANTVIHPDDQAGFKF